MQIIGANGAYVVSLTLARSNGRTHNIQTRLWTTPANSEAEAVGIANMLADREFPARQGWTRGSAVAVRLDTIGTISPVDPDSIQPFPE